MAKKPPKKFRHAIEYLAVRALIFGLALPPFGLAAWIGRRLGDLLRIVDKRHRLRAYEQVRERIGIEGPELDAFVRDNFRSYGMTMTEFARLWRLKSEDFERYVDFAGSRERAQELLGEGKGLIFITSHFGNWEWSNATSKNLGVEGGSIARPLDNPRVNELVRAVREKTGLRILDKQGAIRKALGILRQKNTVAILIDQDAGRGGMMSDFLGKPASTITIPVELAIRTGSPMMTIALKRGGVNGKRFTFLYNSEPHRPNPDADPKTETRRLVDALNADLGKLIMQAPEQWLWIHRRWKSVGVKQ